MVIATLFRRLLMMLELFAIIVVVLGHHPTRPLVILLGVHVHLHRGVVLVLVLVDRALTWRVSMVHILLVTVSVHPVKV